MGKIKIYGHSDDLIEVEGLISEEFIAFEENTYLAFSDGTVLRVSYETNGIWRIYLTAGGTAMYSKDENPDDDDDRYSDVVTLDGNIRWVVAGPNYERATKSEAI